MFEQALWSLASSAETVFVLKIPANDQSDAFCAPFGRPKGAKRISPRLFDRSKAVKE